MARKPARVKAWHTFRESMIQYASENPEFSLEDFKLQRLDASYQSWREARKLERNKQFKKARNSYLKAVESFEQVEKLEQNSRLTALLDELRSEYTNFVVYRDPEYRLILSHLMPIIKATPGIVQTELYTWELPGIRREDMTYALYFAENEGLIRREKKGRSYQVFFAREKPADPPLQKIQNDVRDEQEKAEEKKGCLSGAIIFLLFGAAFALGGPFGVLLLVILLVVIYVGFLLITGGLVAILAGIITVITGIANLLTKRKKK
jgi:hypothetical protein